MVDEHLKYKQCDEMLRKTADDLLKAMVRCWIRFFGPPQLVLSDQESAIKGDILGKAMDV